MMITKHIPVSFDINVQELLSIFGDRIISVSLEMKAYNYEKKFYDYIKFNLNHNIRTFPGDINGLFKLFPDFLVIFLNYPGGTNIYFNIKLSKDKIEEKIEVLINRDDIFV